ncbi:MAG TPA: glycoside hydrolase family 3 C-terminal domain-containing protein [Solirubrobacter sp.]|nr:glycoside hydrolase family 3 C-terminal domain-containing protein [Solirubrobacter sp.]
MEHLLRERLQALSLERKVRLLTGADFWGLHDEPAIGLRRIVMSDGPAGVRGERWDERSPSANVPSPTALAATWDEGRVARLGGLLAFEARRKDVDVVLAPTVNLHRTPLGGRAFECFSEDPYLTARIGAAYVRGLQDAGVAATAKHFVANDAETERFTVDVEVEQRVLRELYLAPFETLGAWVVMAAYNGVNGTTMTESPLLRDVLKDEWGFDGVVVSDWRAARDTVRAGAGGLDLAMPGPEGPWGDALVAAVRDGRVSEAAVDDKVLRLLRLAARVGALDLTPTSHSPRSWSEDEIAAELRATAAASFVLARNHGALLPMTTSSLRRVAVIGPNAATARTLGGGSATVFPPYTVSPLEGIRSALHVEVTYAPGVKTSSRLAVAPVERAEVRFLAADGTPIATETRATGQFTWLGTLPPGTAAIEVRTTLTADTAGEHVLGCSGVGRHTLTVDGTERFAVDLPPAPGADLGDALFAPPQHGVPLALDAGAALDVVLRHEPSGPAAALQLNFEPPFGDPDAEFDRAVQLARDADIAIVVVGTTAEVESEGHDRTSLALPGRQDDLVRAVNAAQPRTIAVVNAGAPVLLPWFDRVPATLLTWFGGQELGHALADVVFGHAEPGGRVPSAWPATEDGLPSTTPQDGVLRYDEGLAIGRHGATPVRIPFGHGLGYTHWDYLAMAGNRVRLVNSGTRRGREVVQVYTSGRLAGFAVVEAGPGEEVIVDVPLNPRAFQRWDGGGWRDEPGPHTLHAGRSSADLRLSSPWS